MSKDPQNGPTFSKAPPKRHKPNGVPSPARKQAELDQTARDCAKARQFNKDPVAWVKERILKKKGLA
jgi:hypothetical protein